MKNSVTLANVSVTITVEPAIKQEFPNPSTPSMPTSFLPASPFKRSFSPERPMPDLAKRQRIEGTPNGSRILENDDFMRILAQATASTNLQIEQSRPSVSPLQIQAGRVTDGIAFHTTRDPYLYMRVLSLPILESLVRWERALLVQIMKE